MSDSVKYLSVREIEVLEWVSIGKSNWEISRILDISISTVKNHVSNILSKLNAYNRTQAAIIAISQRLIGSYSASNGAFIKL